MTQRVEFEGTIHEFPDDFTDDEIAAALQSAAPAPQQAPAGPRTSDEASALVPVPGLSPEEARAARAVPGRPAAAPTTPAPSPILAGVQAVGAGLANAAGMPVDLAATALNAGAAGAEFLSRNAPFVPSVQLGRIDPANAIGSSQWIRRTVGDAAAAAGYPVVDSRTLPPDQRLVFRGTEDATTALAGGQMMRRLGQAVREAMSPPGRPMPMGPIERPYVEQPVRALATDTAAGAGMAAGQTALDANRVENPYARMFVDMIAGAEGAAIPSLVTAPARAVQTARQFFAGDRAVPPDPITGVAPRVNVADEAAQRMQGAAVNPAQARATIGERAAQYDAAGMPVPTTGLISNDEGLIGLERGIRGNSPQIINRDRAVGQAATEQVQATAPPGVPAEPDARAAVRQRATDRVEQQVADTRRAVENYEQGARIRSESALQAERDAAGQIAQRADTQPAAAANLDRALVDETMRPMQTEQRRLYNAIPNTPLPADDLLSLTQRIRESIPPSVPESEIGPLTTWLNRIEQSHGGRQVDTGVLDASGNPIMRDIPAQVGARDLNELRPFLDDSIRQARRDGNFTYADRLSQLRAYVNQSTERLAASGGPGGAEAQAAVRYTRDEIAPRFGSAQPDMADLRRRVNADPTNRSQAPREETARTFLGPQPDSGEGVLRGQRLAEQLQRALQGSPSEEAGRAAARDFVMASMRGVVGADGRVNVARLDSWTRQNAGATRSFPEIEQELTAMRRDIVNRRAATTQMQRQLEDATALRGRTEREIQNSAAAMMLGADPIRGVERIFTSANPQRYMEEMVTRLRNDPEAMAGFRTAVTDFLMQRITRTNTAATAEGARNTSLAQIENLFLENRRTLETLYGRGSREMTALENAHRAVTDMARLGVRGVQGSETAPLMERILERIGVPIRAPAALGGFGAVTGGMVMRNLRTAVGSIPALNNEAAVQRLLQRAMLDPAIAQHLLARDIPAARQPAWNRRLTELMALQDAGAGDRRE